MRDMYGVLETGSPSKKEPWKLKIVLLDGYVYAYALAQARGKRVDVAACHAWWVVYFVSGAYVIAIVSRCCGIYAKMVAR